MYTTRISTPPLSATPTNEDIFSSALSTLFTDDVQNSHGDPGSSVTYHSPRFGDISLRIPAHPDVEDGRRLFAHYLWNAGVICADAIEVASWEHVAPQEEEGKSGDESQLNGLKWDKRYWNVQGKRVLELGAATALPSIISSLSGASHILITDHPSSPALTTGAIGQNVASNISKNLPSPESLQVCGYAWGTNTMYSTEAYGRPASPQPQVSSFDRIIVADCLWMPSQHANIVESILRYLRYADGYGDTEQNDACALIVAGFHTGRDVVRNFFGAATGDWGMEDTTSAERDAASGDGVLEEERDEDRIQAPGKLNTVVIFEIDVNGETREWQPFRPSETKHQAKRWCVCAVLTRR